MCVNALAYLVLATEDKILTPAVVGFLVVAKLTLASFVSMLSNRAIHERDTAFFGLASGFALLHGLAECLAKAGTAVIVVLGLGADLSVANWAVCLLLGGVGSTELSEFVLVVFLDLAFALFLRLGSCLDGSFQLLVSLFSSALCRGTGSNSSLVGGLCGGVRRGGVERLALALGQGAESPGAELDRRTGSLGDLGDGVLVVLVGLILGLCGSLDTFLAAARALLAIGESVHGLLAGVDVSFDVFAGLGDELATVFVALACGSHLVDLLLSLGEVIVQSKEGLLRDNVVLRHVRRRGVDDRERKDEDCATHYFLERCLRCEPH